MSSNTPLSSMVSSKLDVNASYFGGNSGDQVHLSIFNPATTPYYLAMWHASWLDHSARGSIECIEGSLPYRLLGQDNHSLLISVGSPGLKEIKELSIMDGSRKHHRVPDVNISSIRRAAERNSLLFDKPRNLEFENKLRECNVEITTKIETDANERRNLIVEFHNTSDLEINLTGAEIKWKVNRAQADNQDTRRAAASGISVERIGGSVGLRSLSNLSKVIEPGKKARFTINDTLRPILMEIILDDVLDEDIEIIVFTNTAVAWIAKEDEVPIAIRDYARHLIEEHRANS